MNGVELLFGFVLGTAGLVASIAFEQRWLKRKQR